MISTYSNSTQFILIPSLNSKNLSAFRFVENSAKKKIQKLNDSKMFQKCLKYLKKKFFFHK